MGDVSLFDPICETGPKVETDESSRIRTLDTHAPHLLK